MKKLLLVFLPVMAILLNQFGGHYYPILFTVARGTIFAMALRVLYDDFTEKRNIILIVAHSITAITLVFLFSKQLTYPNIVLTIGAILLLLVPYLGYRKR